MFAPRAATHSLADGLADGYARVMSGARFAPESDTGSNRAAMEQLRADDDTQTSGIPYLGAGLSVVPARAQTVRLVAFGDSLTAGYGLQQEESYPYRLQSALREREIDVVIENAGVSGDTSSAAAQRLDWSVPEGTDGVIVALGGNDLLRGTDPAVTARAMQAIIERLRQRAIPVLLAGMRAPANLGEDYVRAFDAVFAELGQREDVIYMPFFLEGVAASPGLNQADGIHPNAEGVDVIVENILPFVLQLIERTEKSG